MGTASWGMLLLGSVVAVLAVGLPGAFIGLTLRLRGLWFAASTPLLGVFSIALASVWSDVFHARWSWWVVVATSAAIGGLLIALRRTLVGTLPPGGRATSTGWRWAPLVAAGAGTLLLTVRFVVGVGRPDWFAQSGDNVFHLNAVRWVLDHGDASPFHITEFAGGSRGSFYPDTWHAVVALVCQLTGASIPLASNSALFAVTCVVWPVGTILLTRTIFGAATPLLVSAGALSAGFAAYPFLLIPYMGTYPLVFAIALVPPALACVFAVLGRANETLPRPAAGVVLAIGIPAIALTHPSAFTTLTVLAISPVFAALWAFGRTRRARLMPSVLLAVTYLAAVTLLILLVRPPLAQPKSPQTSPVQTLVDVLSGGFAAQAIPIVVSVLMVVGATLALARREWNGYVAVGMWATAAFIYFASASTNETFRVLMSEPWYADAERVAAFMPITIVPLAARGAEGVWNQLIAKIDFDSHAGFRRAAQVVAVTLLSGLLVASAASLSTMSFMRAIFTPAALLTPPQHVSLTTPVPLSRDDRALLARMGQFVSKKDLVAGNPWNGSGFVYALTGRRVLLPGMLAPIDRQTRVFLEEFAASSPNGPGCKAAQRLHVAWVLDLHPRELAPTRPHYAGVTNLESSPNATLVDRVGESGLYKVTGCGV